MTAPEEPEPTAYEQWQQAAKRHGEVIPKRVSGWEGPIPDTPEQRREAFILNTANLAVRQIDEPEWSSAVVIDCFVEYLSTVEPAVADAIRYGLSEAKHSSSDGHYCSVALQSWFVDGKADTVYYGDDDNDEITLYGINYPEGHPKR